MSRKPAAAARVMPWPYANNPLDICTKHASFFCRASPSTWQLTILPQEKCIGNDLIPATGFTILLLDQLGQRFLQECWCSAARCLTLISATIRLELSRLERLEAPGLVKSPVSFCRHIATCSVTRLCMPVPVAVEKTDNNKG